jgi:hypothetical protein
MMPSRCELTLLRVTRLAMAGERGPTHKGNAPDGQVACPRVIAKALGRQQLATMVAHGEATRPFNIQKEERG